MNKKNIVVNIAWNNGIETEVELDGRIKINQLTEAVAKFSPEGATGYKLSIGRATSCQHEI